MKKMLFNAAHTEETRVVVVDGRNLQDLILEHSVNEQKKANIYKGKITRIEPSLEAAFIDYGQERHGFLPLKEVAEAYSENQDHEVERKRITDVLKEGQEILVQVEKEERGNKGAALSTFISLAGSYLVLIPNNPHAGGISRRIEGEEREQLREMLSQLVIPQGMGVIIRTAGIGKSVAELQWDLDYLISLWKSISHAGNSVTSPNLIYQESNICVRAIRDHLRDDVEEIWVDDEKVFEQVKKHIGMIRPGFVENVKFYNKTTPLFTHHQIESQIEQVFEREVRLPSGGSIVLDRTEALIAIDINSAQSTKGGDIEETALHTNLEACDEIAKQLRLRDLGGLVVIDFIDMTPSQHQRQVENRLRDAAANDRARIQMGRISRFGMLEMSRQRLRSALAEATQVVCPRCHGRGTIRSTESIAISILRVIEENASKQGTQAVHVHVPVDVATYLLNEKRDDIKALENRQDAHAVIIPTASLDSPHFHINRIRGNKQHKKASYELELESDIKSPDFLSNTQRKEQPILKNMIHEEPAPLPKKKRQHTARKPHKKPSGGLLGFLKRLFGIKEEPKKPHHKKRHPGKRPPHQRGNRRKPSNTSKRHHGSNGGNRHPANAGNRQRNNQNNNSRRRNNGPGGKNRRRNTSDNKQATHMNKPEAAIKPTEYKDSHHAPVKPAIQHNTPQEKKILSEKPMPKKVADIDRKKVIDTTDKTVHVKTEMADHKIIEKNVPAKAARKIDNGGFIQIETQKKSDNQE